ncbi:acetyl-CoA carboxylase biotin carboxylase subunit [Rhodohalobacter sulfatireducens]|uniref:Acetyl-CoA carboxylase biotin carboxylase subunit n=1 Tax=Rhodohalobacter sulfatireducens TaxID=2911366 RepID=A0ABS9KJK5_9BACT|nr:acetyl-CoA carboxylase biotin carboxylase subunit [Rhodohalobacter sulfatireducens]MCG2591019.1 acetyl-CoA carboxylase biotin carboxylase subunit [Rhodohalobacter sulfatireducens]
MASIKKVLIANRGEIAVRVIRSCREKGIETVSVYSTPDKTAPHVLAADESYHIGEAASSESYLKMEKIIEVAKESGADAIHPGYGFLSENATFANLCEENDINFIGPTAYAIEMMGDKTKARELMAKTDVPFPPGTESAMEDIQEAKKIAKEIGYPVLIKAAAGGGGKGMRIVHNEDLFEGSVKAAKSEARSAFGDDRVFVEKYLEEPRHIEFQVFADTHGNVVHMFERECSVQRRHQKVIEEAPSAIMTDELRKQMGDAACTVAKSCNYVGAGTVEFLVDKYMNFYFLEMNTRLQVEHPVTELITGLDLVSLQIDVAEGKELPFKQEDIKKRGHAVECRIYAEDPSNKFLPSTGTLHRHRIPAGPGIRVDAGIEEGQDVSIYYDPMISKLCTFANDREKAIDRMLRALDEYEISGVRTTIPFCQFTLKHEKFREGQYDTHFVPDHFTPENMSDFTDKKLAAIVSSVLRFRDEQSSTKSKPSGTVIEESVWWEKRKAVQ